MNRPAQRLSVPLLALLLAAGCAAKNSAATDAAPAQDHADGPTDAELARRADELRQQLPAGFTVIVEPPFVVIGDEPAATVRERAAGTIRFAVGALRRDFGFAAPAEPIDIWLFRDEDSYRRHASELLGETPETPYGYFSPGRRALVMNIATGGGTLIHELVHPFLAATLPGCPPWFNEGLGSLYEGVTDRDGHLWGLPNWRLPGLQEAVVARRTPRVAELTAMDAGRFYDDDSGVHYGMARYLLLHLQERGLLFELYRRLRDGIDEDPTGADALRAALGEPDLDAFQRRWESWVLELRWDAPTGSEG